MNSETLKPGWKVWRFDQIATNVNVRIDNPSESGMEHYVGLEHLDSDSLKIRRWGTPNDVAATKLMFKKGDIIFGRRRAYQRKLGVAEFDGICSAHAMVLRAKHDVVLPEFLPFFMQSDLFMNRAVEISVGSLSPTINWKTMAVQEFALPPLDEQMRVVELLGAVEEQVESVVEAMDNLLQVKAAFVERFISASSESRPTIVLGDGCTRVTDGTHQPPTFTDQGIPFFLVKTISSGFVDWASTNFVSRKTYDELTRRVKPKRGDVLYTAVGATYGVALLVDFDESFVFQRHIAHIIPNPEKLLGRYIEEFLNSRVGKRQSDRSAIGSAQPTVTLKSLSNFKLPLPTLEEQEDFVAELESITTALRHLEGRLQSVRAIRARALNGELV
ncbi:restriction endonuclease subunit S [Aeromonas veronii]